MNKEKLYELVSKKYVELNKKDNRSCSNIPLQSNQIKALIEIITPLLSENKIPVDVWFGKNCKYQHCKSDMNGDVDLIYCSHKRNLVDFEGNCRSEICPTKRTSNVLEENK